MAMDICIGLYNDYDSSLTMSQTHYKALYKCLGYIITIQL